MTHSQTELTVPRFSAYNAESTRSPRGLEPAPVRDCASLSQDSLNAATEDTSDLCANFMAAWA